MRVSFVLRGIAPAIFFLLPGCIRHHKGPVLDFGNTLCQTLGTDRFPVKRLRVTHLPFGKPTDYPMVVDLLQYNLAEVPTLYNSSLVGLPDGGYLLSQRFDCMRRAATETQDYTLISELDAQLHPRGNIQFLPFPIPGHPQSESHGVDDIRLFTRQGHIWAVGNDERAEMGGKRLSHLFRLEKSADIWMVKEAIGLNRPNHATQAGPEKNWTPISGGPWESNNPIFNYYLWPKTEFITAHLSEKDARLQETSLTHSCTPAHMPWDIKKWGGLRGGTPAIWLEDKQQYLSLFHSAERQGKNKWYYMGAYTFSPKSGCLTGISKEPITYGDMYKGPKGRLVQSFGPEGGVVFPMGLVDAKREEKSVFLIAFGSNDTESKILVLDREKLLESLVPIEEK